MDLICLEQRKAFPEVFTYFEAEQPLLKDIPEAVNKLNAYVADDHLIRVKGKFNRPKRDGTAQYFRILLPKESPLTRLIILNLHHLKCHIGIYALLSELWKVFYVPSYFSTVKKALKICTTCKRFNNKPLPLNQSPYRHMRLDPPQIPFRSIYMDYIGPINVYQNSKKSKAYILCISCIWSRAVNLVLCEDASAGEFLRAFQLHTYMYGIPSFCMSDLGSNLTAGSKIIQDYLSEAETHAFFEENGISTVTFDNYFKGCSKLGGLVEIIVKYVKKLIFGAIKTNILKFREFEFIIAHCTHIINRRPVSFKEALRALPDDDLPEIITPQLLINGYPLVSVNIIPELHIAESDPDLDSSSEAIRMNYHKLLKVKSNLTKIYHEQFLSQLASQALDRKDRYKPVNHDPPEKGDLVLIKETFSKPHTYPMGKVMKVYRNINDEVTNVEVLKGKTRELTKRHISSVITFLKVDGTSETSEDLVGRDSHVIPPTDRPKRLAAKISGQKTKDILADE